MRVGVVGCGYWGSRHVRVLQQLPGVDGVAVIDASEERRTLMLRSFPAARAFPDLKSALDEVQAVVVATPPQSHAALARQALEAGRHVLIEKPMTTTSADARGVIALAEARGLTLMVGHTFEYNPAVRMLREIVASGELGRIYYLDSARLNLGKYQSDVNVVWDLAPHDVSIMNFVLGSSPSTVQAWGATHAHWELEDVAYVRLQYADLGMTAQIHVSWLDPCKVRRLTVVGGRKMAVYNDLADEERIRIYDKGVVAAPTQDMHGVPMSYRYGGITSPYVTLQEPLALQDQHFVDCVRTGQRPQTDGQNGLRVVEVLEAAARSMARQRAVPMPRSGADAQLTAPGPEAVLVTRRGAANGH
jgi:predicted dehydrogenase